MINIHAFVKLFRQDSDAFKHADEHEIMKILFAVMKDKNLSNQVIEEIKKDENEGTGNIYYNLLTLMPFSNKVIEAFLASGFLGKSEFYKPLKVVWLTNNAIIEHLTDFKCRIRAETLPHSVQLEQKLDEVNRALKEKEADIKKQQEYEQKKKELEKLDNVDLETLAKDYETLKKTVDDYKKLQQQLSEERNSTLANLKSLRKDALE